MIIFPIAGTVLLTAISILAVFLAAGAPLGELTMGGKYPGVLPKPMRIFSAVSVLLQIVAILDILCVGNIISLGISSIVLRIVCMVFAVYFLINAVMNLFSRSKKEKYIMTTLSAIISICFFVTFAM